MSRPCLVLVDRPGSRGSCTVLAAAVEGSSLAADVDLRFASTVDAIVEAIRSASGPVVCGWPFLSAGADVAYSELHEVVQRTGGARGDTPRAAAASRRESDRRERGRREWDGRESDRRAWHVAGGPHPTARPREALEAGFDLVVTGEGERALLALLARVREGADPRGAGTAWLDGSLVRGARAPPVVLDDHPPFSRVRGRAGPIELTRGCVHACAYCQTSALHGPRLRHRSPRAVAAAAAELRARGMRDLRFVTPSALSYGGSGEEVRLDEVGALLEAARAAMRPDGRIFLGSFPSELRPEHATRDALALLRRHVANDGILLGAQSGSDRMLSLLRRGHTVEHVREAVRRVKESGFRPEVDFIVGLPGEEEPDREATRRLMAWCAEQGARVHGHAFTPLPGSSLEAAAAGIPDADTAALLARLEGRGGVYGRWRPRDP